MLFDVLPENFFSLLSGKNRTLYWECIYKLFSVTEKRLSFGLARDDAAEELELYFDSAFATDFQEDDDADSRSLRSRKRPRTSAAPTAALWTTCACATPPAWAAPRWRTIPAARP